EHELREAARDEALDGGAHRGQVRGNQLSRIDAGPACRNGARQALGELPPGVDDEGPEVLGVDGAARIGCRLLDHDATGDRVGGGAEAWQPTVALAPDA